ncbi:MAG TPA: PIN domain-containing protein [Rhizomicrobium sp.]|jgi:hypothetical protein|nr:PIN domain-containing protein [Rhizomicrobium sp.]
MFHLLIDTCVWLDLAKEPAQQPLLSALEELVRSGDVVLVIPQTVVDEFARNRDRIIRESNRSLSSVIKRVKVAVDKFGDAKQKRRVLEHLNELDHKLPQLGDTTSNSVARIEALLSTITAIPTSDEILARAAQRAVERRAPFHRERNSINDAILLEIYTDYVRANGTKGSRFALVTHNTKDFSQPQGNTKIPHPDLAALFSQVKSLYAITLSDVLKRIAPGSLRDAEFEENYHEEPRRLAEILEAIDELFDKVWYNRHLGLRYGVEDGKITVVDGEYDYRDQTKVRRDIWKGALKAAQRVEKKRGLENLGPWDDFEWGMINGKLSALRWVLGDEWDMLDT